MNAFLNMFCLMITSLVSAVEETDDTQLTKDSNVTLSFDCDGRKYNVCVTVEEVCE